MSSEDPLILATVAWNESFTGNMIKTILVTVVLILLLIMTFTLGNLREIAENWPRYRCNPAFMPLASNFGYDVKENFDFCLNSIFRTKASEVFRPIYGLLANFTGIVTLVTDVAIGIRKLFGNFLFSMNSFVRSVRDRIQNLLFRIRISYMRLNVLMGRVYGSMYSMIWMGTSALTSAMSLPDNGLVKFIIGFCFDPNTVVHMADGTTKLIKHIQIGDLLKGGRATSVFRFDGSRTPMVQIGDVVISSNHLVQCPDGVWRVAEAHPDATPVPSIPDILCLNVEGHRFTVGIEHVLQVADYDESESDLVVSTAQQLAEAGLNAGLTGPVIKDYSLGFEPDAEIRISESEWIGVSDIAIGRELYGGQTVMGLVEEECASVCRMGSIRLSSAQLVFTGSEWKRAGTVLPVETSDVPTRLVQVITDRVGPLCLRRGTSLVWIRDYREAPLPEMEDVYQGEVCGF